MNRLIEIYAADEVRKFDESSLPLLIGMDETAHIHLDAHLDGGRGIVAYVAESRNHLFLQPADDNQAGVVYHNDEPVTGSVWLKAGDTTRIGDAIIRWHLAGQRVEIRVSKTSAKVLQPPLAPPVEPPPKLQRERQKNATVEHILPVMETPRAAGGRARTLAIVLFALLLTAAAFVLLANPLTVTVTPAPDSLSVSGFPPVLPFGDSYLGLSGSYTIHAEKSGYRPLKEEVEITNSGSNYSFTLEKLPGLIDLSSTPAGVTVLIDGTSVGETPLDGVEVSAGSRVISFTHKRYLPVERTIEVEGFGKKLVLQVELQPAWAMTTLQTEPQGATLMVDGEEQGVTPLELELTAGKHQLVFSKENFSTLEAELVVEAGKNLTPDVYRLEPAPATLAIASTPAGGTVTLDGVYKGLTPLSITLPSGGEHRLRLTMSGYLPVNSKLTLEPGEERELSVKLKPQYGTVFITGTPAAATLYIDGSKQELATGRFRLTTRAHTIEMKAKGYASVTRTVTPQTGYSQRIEIDLKRKQTAGQAATSAKPGPAARPDATKVTGLGQKMILISPQPFLMGASRKEAGRRANEGERKVIMKRSFYISEREVTNAEYRLFRAQHSSGMSGNRSLEIDSHPVVNIAWDDAARFLNWLSSKDNLPPFYREENGAMVAGDEAGLGYRLPTESEWAFTARMAKRPQRVRYPWSGKYPPQTKAGNFADESARHLLPVVIKGYNDGFAASAPTGSFPANPVGVHDLGGNVAEWCHDYYAANPAGSKGADPMGPAVGNHHVVRGSSWRNASITELRFSYRRYSREPASDIGFRIARYAK